MVDKIIYFSIKNKLIIFIFTLFLVISGAYSLTQIPIDAVPDITNNQVQIITNAPSFSAQEVERLVTARLEISLATLQQVVEIRSISRFGLSVITVVFEEEMPIYLARQLVSEKMKMVEQEIPPEMGKPMLAPISTGLSEIYQYVIKPQKGFENQYDITTLRTIQDWIVKRRLAGTKGVVDISSFGGKVKQYEVAINPEKLRANNLSLHEVMAALQNNNQNTGGSYIEKNAQAYFIRSEGWIKNKQDIENIVVKNTQNLPILVKDIAQVQLGSAVRYGAMSQDGKGEVVGGIVLMLKGENSAKVISHVREKIQEIQQTLPQGLVIETFLDRSDLVQRAIATVTSNLIEGGLIVIFVLILFLANWRAGFIVASVIPLAMLFALSMMYIFGVSANLMSLGAIDFGLVVDGAVIIVEVIVHRLHTLNKTQTIILKQADLEKVVYEASTQIRQSAAFGELIILIVYLPILSLVGIEGKMFRPMAQTVGFAIIGALILSLTYVPMMAAFMLNKKIKPHKTMADKAMIILEKYYLKILLFTFRKKYIFLGSIIVFFGISISIFANLGGEFIPQLDEGDFAIEVRLQAGTNLSQTLATSQKLEKILKQFPEVKTVISKIGTAEIPTDPMPMEANDLMVILKDKSTWQTATTKKELADTLRKALSQVIGVGLDFQQPIAMRFNELMTGVKSDIALKIYGEDLDILFQKAQECAKHIRKVEGVVDVKIEQLVALPQITVQYHRDKIAQYGLNIRELNSIIKTAFAGEVAGQVYEGERYFDLVLRLDTTYRNDTEQVKNLYINLPNTNNQVPLSELATIQYQNAVMQVSRDDTKRRITVGFNAQSRDVESIVREVKQILNAKVSLPVGYYFQYGGQFENLEQAKVRLLIAVPIALLLIFSLLYFTFNSFKQSLLIFTAIPLSAIGGIFALYLRQMPFSISAGVGFIALFGVAVLNGIVLIGYFNQLAQTGVSNLYRRIIIGTQTRLRPVLMTAAVASLGFLPMALSQGAGAEVQKPLATVVIGGLFSATILTLLVLPILYSIFNQIHLSIKLGRPKNMLLIIFFMFLFNTQSYAQNRSVSLEEAINLAIINNQHLKAARLAQEAAQQNEQAAWDLPRTMFEFQYGNVNDKFIDNSLNITQNFALPLAYKRQKKWLQQQTFLANQYYFIIENELIKQVKLVYLQGIYEYEKAQLLQEQVGILQEMLVASQKRLQAGEAALLENLMIETQLQEILNQQDITQQNIVIQATELQKILNAQQPLSWKIPKLVAWQTQKVDSQAIERNPALAYTKQLLNTAQAYTQTLKSRLLPDFKVGYFNMSLEGKRNTNRGLGFQVLQLGTSLPLWRKADKSRIQAAQTYTLATQAQWQGQRSSLQKELEIYQQHWQKYQKSLQYYQNFALPQAEKIQQQTEKGFKAGEVGYVAMLQSRLQVFAIKQGYLDTLLAHNQTIIQIDFLTPKN